MNPTKPITVPDFIARKGHTPIVMITAADFTMARLIDSSGLVDCLLVGDSLGTVVQGRPNTLSVTLDQMIYHTELVVRGSSKAMVVADMPFGSYHESIEQAIRNVSRVIKETGCAAVKLEGGRHFAPTVSALVQAGIPVMGHVGLMPQHVHSMGGYKVQRNEHKIMDDAKAIADAGAFGIVLECLPADLAANITTEVKSATIGIGAGPLCDGQVLVGHDLLGLFDGHRPKFVRPYADLKTLIREAVTKFAGDVQSRAFPDANESFR
ncbi:MAG: 3-methyl-2-oxobutanoate hydroxymethyltransferase [bacterium]